MKMRRADREIVDPSQIEEIINTGRYVHIAYADEEGLTIVPITYYAEKKDGHFVLWAHGAMEGRKVRAFERGAPVAFEIEVRISPIFSDNPSNNSWLYETVVGNAKSAIEKDPKVKLDILAKLVEKHTGKPCSAIDPAMASATHVFRFDVTNLSAKQRKAS